MRRITLKRSNPIALILAISYLPGLDLVQFRYIPALDDFVAQLDFHGHRLELEMDWGGSVSLTADPVTPQQIFDQVSDHLSTHKLPWFKSPSWWWEFERQYRRPAKVMWYEKG